MPQFPGAVVIADGASTPVNVSYSPELLSSGETVLVDRREASREMQPSLTVRFDRASAARKTFKVTHEVAYPLVRMVTGVSTTSDTARAKVVFTIPANATVQERKNLRALVANGLSATILKAGVEDLDPLY